MGESGSAEPPEESQESPGGDNSLLVPSAGDGSGSGSGGGANALHSDLGEAEAWIHMALSASKTDPGPHSN